jgi:2'-5' RNA ligase
MAVLLGLWYVTLQQAKTARLLTRRERVWNATVSLLGVITGLAWWHVAERGREGTMPSGKEVEWQADEIEEPDGEEEGAEGLVRVPVLGVMCGSRCVVVVSNWRGQGMERMLPGYDRCFIGISMPPKAKRAVLDVQQRLGLPGLVNWERESDLHLTLKFLGDTSKEIQSRLRERLARLGRAHGAFRLKLGRLGVFRGRNGRLNVIWASVEGQVTELKKLRRSVAGVASRLGFRSDVFKFNPHITVGRCSERAAEQEDSQIERAATGAEIEGACEFEVSSFSLMKTERGYHSVGDFQLRS